jgi:hypothetical protein
VRARRRFLGHRTVGLLYYHFQIPVRLEGRRLRPSEAEHAVEAVVICAAEAQRPASPGVLHKGGVIAKERDPNSQTADAGSNRRSLMFAL